MSSWEDPGIDPDDYYHFAEGYEASIIAEFTDGRLRSVFLAEASMAGPVVARLSEARALARHHSSAAMALAGSAVELALRNLLLRPVVAGSVHDERAAPLVAAIIVGQQQFDRLRALLLHVLAAHGADLKAIRRPGQSESLWDEMEWVRRRRNEVMHRGDIATEPEAQRALEVAAAVIEGVFPTVLRSVGLHAHEGLHICADPDCGPI